MEVLFPQHLCVLARKENKYRCSSPHDATDKRCSTCRKAMQNEVWRALAYGDKSFAEFVLAESSLMTHQFSIGFYEGDEQRDPVFALISTRTKTFSEPGDTAIIPEQDGAFRVYTTINEEDSIEKEGEDLAKAWRIAERLQKEYRKGPSTAAPRSSGGGG